MQQKYNFIMVFIQLCAAGSQQINLKIKDETTKMDCCSGSSGNFVFLHAAAQGFVYIKGIVLVQRGIMGCYTLGVCVSCNYLFEKLKALGVSLQNNNDNSRRSNIASVCRRAWQAMLKRASERTSRN